jgi:uncharacterized protein (TIGR03067 family)
MRACVLVASSVALIITATLSAQEDAVKKELAKLEGTWSIVSAEENKEAVPADIVNELKFVFKGSELTLKGVERIINKVAKVKIKIDPGTTPKTIDFTIEAGSEKGSVIEGIYELKGDDLKVCAQTVERNRPTEFATKPASNLILFVLKRDK